jgi:Protein of unknown function (DUF1566)/Sulfatase-modifying factor enzyme 1
MKLFSRPKTAARTQEAPATGGGKKIELHFGRQAAKSVEAIAAATLEAGGFDAAAAAPKDPEAGDKMPDGTIYAGISPDTGKAMYVTPADAPMTTKWREAMDYAAKLNTHGRQDWRLPTQGELSVLFNNRAAIGGFDVTGSYSAGLYWSGTQDDRWAAWGQRFSDGDQFGNDETNHSSVRCVR